MNNLFIEHQQDGLEGINRWLEALAWMRRESIRSMARNAMFWWVKRAGMRWEFFV